MSSSLFFSPRAFDGENLDKIAYPVGGTGAGMFALGGNGSFASFSIRHLPDYFTLLMTFSAVAIKDRGVARVLEGQVPAWKPLFPWNRRWQSSGHGGGNKGFGLPRFERSRFSARFPFATVQLEDDGVPLAVEVKAWSPFVPGDTEGSALPAGAVDYKFRNVSDAPLDFVYSFHSKNFLSSQYDAANGRIEATLGGFVLHQEEQEGKPEAKAAIAAWIDDPAAKVDLAWFRGGWFDAETVLWKNISEGNVVEQAAYSDSSAAYITHSGGGQPSNGASIYLPLRLQPGEERTVRLLLAWYAPYSSIREYHPGRPEGEETTPKVDFYRPWYSARFAGIGEVADHWTRENKRLYAETAAFTDAFYDTSLPPEVIDAVASNLTILKSPTVLREYGGRLWAWEGTGDEMGSCHGTCTHVWNYAQALPHLFPEWERSLRETEYFLSQNDEGHQDFRSAIPLRPTPHTFHAAADGQLGGIVKVYRDWRISGDTEWMRRFWPRVKQSLEYCITHWDPERTGRLAEPHHNTYDIEFWGADGMCASFYLAALRATAEMGRALGEDVAEYERLAGLAKAVLEGELFNGEYFIQNVQWEGLRAGDPVAASEGGVNMNYSPEAKALLEREGPKYQYGTGCLSDGILGEWMAWTAGLAPGVDARKTESHVRAVYRHNFRADLSTHVNLQRPAYAFNHEGGLLLCSWPRGGKPTLPFVYSDEVWTGIEYHVAAHLISFGQIAEGLEIVRACRSRYEGRIRNPFSEIECGHWYARAMASYALLQAFTGARYDAVEKKLHLAPRLAGDFRSFLAVDGAYGTVGVKDGQPFFEIRSGKADIREIVYSPFQG